ncbi:MAG: hypothetical protein M5U28_30275 [Sandaracinaceae bacterium]|nr:hypothetical protein [Sandaracinaceae bacterium]
MRTALAAALAVLAGCASGGGGAGVNERPVSPAETPDAGSPWDEEPPSYEDAGPSEAVCGDGACDPFTETCARCPLDCGACPSRCGDGACEADETCASCAADCGACGAPGCGDGVCDAFTETCRLCAADCGACPARCGDGLCDAMETASSCSVDCGPRCGDGTCAPTEGCSTCPSDCGSCSSTDPCASSATCGGCVDRSDCGWCRSGTGGTCATGSLGGPADGRHCETWYWFSFEC